MTLDLEEMGRRVAVAVHAHWKLFAVQGVLMMILGLLAVALPMVSTLAVEILVGWLFLVGGLFRGMAVLRSRHTPGFWWSLATSLLAILLGLLLLLSPLEGILTLTVALLVYFIVAGVASIFVAIEFRRHMRHWGWTLLSGLVDLLLAYLITQGWPGSATWAVGLLVGVNLFFFGLSLLMTAVAARSMGSA
jgi:uncharacterized membrane protein HdeD (DUF308 family)